MFWLYREVFPEALRRSWKSWPVALSLIVYAAILFVAMLFASRLGIIGSLLIGLVSAACWSSYLELISQAVRAPRFQLSWAEFKGTFLARFGDVISVMFAFWLISFVTTPLSQGPRGVAISAIIGFAMAFFFNVVPELLYQGNSRSFVLLVDSGKFVMEHPVTWFLPNLLFATIAFAPIGMLDVRHPAELLVLFGTTFSSPSGIAALFSRIPLWGMPIALLGLHFVMVFRGLLFYALVSGYANPRLRDFRRKMGR